MIICVHENNYIFWLEVFIQMDNVEFNIKMRGYDKDEVDKYIEKIRHEFSDVCNHLQEKIKTLETSLSEREDISEVMIHAHTFAKQIKEDGQKEAKKLVDNANAEADEIYSKAEKYAKGIIKDAQKEAEKILTVDEAQKEAEKIIKDAEKESERIVSEAGKEADKIIDAAEVKANSIKTYAEVNAEHIVNDAKEKYNEIENKMEQINNITSLFLKEVKAEAAEEDENTDEFDSLKNKITKIRKA